MKILLLLLCSGAGAFSQIDTAKWWISNLPAWPIEQGNASSTCLLGTQAFIDSGTYLNIGLNGTSSVCHDTNLDGSLKTGPLTESHTGGQLLASAFNFLYGTVEFRVKTPNSNTAWPAVWLLSANCQATYQHSLDNLGACVFNTGPDYNEIDILESIGQPGATALSVYQPPQTPVHQVTNIDITQWHVFSMVWSPGSIILSIDGTVASTVTGSIVPAVALFPIIEDIAVAGSTVPGQLTMLVDYIRITQDGVLVFDDEFTGYNRVLSGGVRR